MDSHVARYLLSLDFTQEDVHRMNLLAERSRDGGLSVDDEAELDSYLRVGNVLTIMQSSSRIHLGTHEGKPSSSDAAAH